MLNGFSVLLLDMNDTFMFGADRFGPDEDYSVIYRDLGGTMDSRAVNGLIQSVYDHLLELYPDPRYRESFPTVRNAFKRVAADMSLDEMEFNLLESAFSFHELGSVPREYADALKKLSARYKLALVADIWSPKGAWIEEFEKKGIDQLFDVMVFSSDSGVVKPSPVPFIRALALAGATPGECVVIGDSVRRDLGGAKAAGLPCILVGGSRHEDAYASVSSFIELAY